MPDFAYIAAQKTVCPKCFQQLALQDTLGFQWGYCRGCVPSDAYEVNDSIVWRRDVSGGIPAWTYFKGGGGNIGDPGYKDLVIRESEFGLRACSHCRYEFAGIAIHIKDGQITTVRVHEIDLPAADISIVHSDGTLLPMPEWDDHPMAVTDGACVERLVPSSRGSPR